MTTAFDAKGKIFTNIVSKQPVPVIIQTITNRINGNIHVTAGGRIKDELNGTDEFLALTDVVVFDNNGNEILKNGFLTVNRQHIVWLTPADVEENQDGKGGEE
ncbi:MAG: hypothetical protein PHQ40_11435 [Anaerolineaceae bacterium]|nr:hypothetical protein [Anaerolineaceae bacterium]